MIDSSVTREHMHYLEYYLFTLLRYVRSREFVQELKDDKQRRILYEIAYIEMALNILRTIFTPIGRERPIIGWEVNSPGVKVENKIIYYFSSAIVAAECTDCAQSNIGEVCRETKKQIKGWSFMYESEYEKDSITLSPERYMVAKL
jgi:hypothetical protein